MIWINENTNNEKLSIISSVWNKWHTFHMHYRHEFIRNILLLRIVTNVKYRGFSSHQKIELLFPRKRPKWVIISLNNFSIFCCQNIVGLWPAITCLESGSSIFEKVICIVCIHNSLLQIYLLKPKLSCNTWSRQQGTLVSSSCFNQDGPHIK